MSELERVNDLSDFSQPIEEDFEAAEIKQRNWLDRVRHIGKRSVQWAIVAGELGPANEAIRAAVFTSAMVASGGDVWVGAAAAGGSTLLIEGAAALATADLITSDKGVDVIKKTNEKLEKYLKIPQEAKPTGLAMAATAFLGGSVVAMTVDQRSNPNRTKAETRNFGLKVSAGLAGALALMGAGAANGIEHITDPKAVGLGLLTIGGIYTGAKAIVKRVRRDS